MPDDPELRDVVDRELELRLQHPDVRSSLWRRRDGGPWRILFHQGTVVPPGTGDAATAE